MRGSRTKRERSAPAGMPRAGGGGGLAGEAARKKDSAGKGSARAAQRWEREMIDDGTLLRGGAGTSRRGADKRSSTPLGVECARRSLTAPVCTVVEATARPSMRQSYRLTRPSCPPLASCAEAVAASAVAWPRTHPSRSAEASRRSDHARCITGARWPRRQPASPPEDPTAQTRTVLSYEVETACWPVEETARRDTDPVCPSNSAQRGGPDAFHRHSLPSMPADSTRPSGVWDTSVTHSRTPARRRGAAPAGGEVELDQPMVGRADHRAVAAHRHAQQRPVGDVAVQAAGGVRAAPPACRLRKGGGSGGAS
eukprot:scaffold1658_cov115-Isochrysis_galbana.AAC.3